MSGPITPPLTVTTVGGTPSGRPITTIKVSDGDLTISGNVATIDTSGSGGVPGGSTTQIQYNNAGAFGGSADFTFSDIGAALPKINILSSTTANKAILSPSTFKLDGGTGLGVLTTTDADQGLMMTTGTEGITGPVLHLDTNTSPSQALLQNQTTDGTITIQTTAGDGDITVDANGDLNLYGDTIVYLRHQATGQVEVRSATDTPAILQVKTVGAGVPSINLTDDTRAITIKCDANQKLKVEGANTFVFDASSATGGITWPDGTTQITAASGGGLTNIVPTGGTAARNVGISLTNNMNGAAAWTANLQTVYSSTWYARPFYAVSDATLGTAKVGVAGAGSAGTTFELAIYDSDSSGHPDTLQSTGSIDTASTGITSTTLTADAGGSTSITENTLYWVAWRGSGTPVTKPYLNGITDDQAFPLFMGEFAGALTPVVAFTGGTTASAPTSFTTTDVAVIDLPMIEGVLT